MLWIMLQDKEAIFKVDNVYKSGLCIYSEMKPDGELLLGRYNSDEECLEVIEKIYTHVNYATGDNYARVFVMPKEKDLSGVESFKVTDNQLNYSTNENKVKQVRLISQQDYFDLIVFLSNIEIAIKNNDTDLALSGLKKKKETLKEKMGEVE